SPWPNGFRSPLRDGCPGLERRQARVVLTLSRHFAHDRKERGAYAAFTVNAKASSAAPDSAFGHGSLRRRKRRAPDPQSVAVVLAAMRFEFWLIWRRHRQIEPTAPPFA